MHSISVCCRCRSGISPCKSRPADCILSKHTDFQRSALSSAVVAVHNSGVSCVVPLPFSIYLTMPKFSMDCLIRNILRYRCECFSDMPVVFPPVFTLLTMVKASSTVVKLYCSQNRLHKRTLFSVRCGSCLKRVLRKV